MLLTLDEITKALEDKFSPLGEDFNDLVLLKRTTPFTDLNFLEQTLTLSLPDDFTSFISLYNLDNFSLFNISFGCGEDYLERLFMLNSPNEFAQWWIGDKRPENVIVIALSDPYTILLNTQTGNVFAMTSESSMDSFEHIAANFFAFFSAVATLFLTNISPDRIIKLTSSQTTSFWHQLKPE
ncbi:SMI1/KNR4 family protein [Proteus sp. ZN5]|uniref:SMI1/KNR4 family protein n=1 Tax=Proteus sp. ZN5 TaxID=2697019 RepID=UPI0013E1CE08|nr:SMI1/KNR4 family protein [Proteus sp. ZN5]QIG07003.1 nuclease [Proteus sp. ZN5]